MRWEGRRESENVEDRRRMSGPVAVGGGGLVLLVAIVIALLGGDPRALLQQVEQQNQARSARRAKVESRLIQPKKNVESLLGLYWLIPKMFGPTSFGRTNWNTKSQRWCCLAAKFNPPVDSHQPPAALLLSRR